MDLSRLKYAYLMPDEIRGLIAYARELEARLAAAEERYRELLWQRNMDDWRDLHGSEGKMVRGPTAMGPRP